jgi:hypothetical protein
LRISKWVPVTTITREAYDCQKIFAIFCFSLIRHGLAASEFPGKTSFHQRTRFGELLKLLKFDLFRNSIYDAASRGGCSVLSAM